MKDIKVKNLPIKNFISIGIIIAIIFILLEWGILGKVAQKTIVLNDRSIQELLLEADNSFTRADSKSYDLKKSEQLYKKVLEQDSTNKEALFHLARIAYVQGSFQAAINYINQFKIAHPDNKRIHYVAGLTQAYAGNLNNAIAEFKEFIDSGISNEAGYLDIAWVYFKKSDFENAKKYLESGLEIAPNNPWLNLSYGAVLHNLQKKDQAIVALEKAKSAADQITPEIWKINYSSNDPEEYQEGIQKFKELIEVNLAIAREEENIHTKVSNISKQSPFETLSQKGIYGGYAVSACCEAYTTSYDINSLGNTNEKRVRNSSFCGAFRNTGSTQYLIPGKTANEINLFRNNLPSGVTDLTP